jgi:endonuclease YncB( thermonuclease family)
VNKTETRAAGLLARDYLKFLLEGKPIIIDSIKDKADKYGGRWLGVIWALQGDGTWLNVNQEMINSGHAVPYNP